MSNGSKKPEPGKRLPNRLRDEGDQELIKQQRAEQTKRGDGKIQPLTQQERLPEPKR